MGIQTSLESPWPKVSSALLVVTLVLVSACPTSDEEAPGSSDVGLDATTVDTSEIEVGTSFDTRPGLDLVEPTATPPGFAAVWSEFMTADEVLDALPLLREHSLALNLAWPVDRLIDDELFEIVAEAQRYGVPVQPWLLLRAEDGYWPGTTNAGLFWGAAIDLVDEWSHRGFEPTTLVVDMELHIERAEELTAFLEADPIDIAGLLRFLRDGVDEAQYATATELYADLVEHLHQRGWRVLLTTLPMILDDYDDDDDSIRQALGIPIEGIDWDVMTFQVYRTLLDRSNLSEAPLTAYVVYDYASTAVDLFGELAGLDLGLVGTGVSGSPTYIDAGALLEDVEAGLAAGVPREHIQVYNLDGIIDRPPGEGWLVPPGEDPSPPEADEATETLRRTIRALDLAN